MSVIAHMDMDAFFASVEQRNDPSLEGRPVVVGADPKGGRGRGVVATCSYEARKYGIHSAMPISEAYRRCPNAVFLRGNMGQYKEISHEVFNLLYDFTDLIEPVSIDEAFFDITGSYHLHGTPLNTCRLIKQRIKTQTGLNASIGIAPVKMVAKIASDLSKPDGLLEVKLEEVQGFLWKLPVSRLWGVGPKTGAALQKMGITHIRELAKADPEILYRYFGEQGLHLHDLANGIDPRGIMMDEEIKSVSNEHTFAMDTADPQEIKEIFSFLSQKISRRLRLMHLKGRTISVKVRTKDFKTVLRSRTLKDRSNYFEVIYTQACRLFQDVYIPGSYLRLIGIKVTNFDDPYVVDSLFSDPAQQKVEQVHKAIDSIKDKFGENAIFRAK